MRPRVPVQNASLMGFIIHCTLQLYNFKHMPGERTQVIQVFVVFV